MFEVRGLIIVHKHREANWLINIHEISLLLCYLSLSHWTNIANCWSVSTVVHGLEEYYTG